MDKLAINFITNALFGSVIYFTSEVYVEVVKSQSLAAACDNYKCVLVDLE